MATVTRGTAAACIFSKPAALYRVKTEMEMLSCCSSSLPPHGLTRSTPHAVQQLGWTLFFKSSVGASQLDLKGVRRTLGTASFPSRLCSEIALGEINGKFASRTEKPSNVRFSTPRTRLIRANNYEPLPSDERQFALTVWSGAET